LAKVVKDDQLYFDVIDAGAMAGTGLDDRTAADEGLVKNHWMARVLMAGAGVGGQIAFGINVALPPSIASDAGQYVPSSRGGFKSDYDASQVGSEDEVPYTATLAASVNRPLSGSRPPTSVRSPAAASRATWPRPATVRARSS
jgi:hypothetical protein